MKLINAYNILKKTNQPYLKTIDVATLLDINITHASKILSRLKNAEQITHIGRGLWVFKDLDPLLLPETLTTPFPTYISLQSALFFHGMIEQIPEKIYAVSIARSKQFITPIASVSIHHLQPDFFFGYENIKNTYVKIATPEKALLDTFYLSDNKTKLFSSLPELEIPNSFDIKKANQIIKMIKSKRKLSIVREKFLKLLENQRGQI
ncbi:MAG: hypothetical protein AB7F64_05350 [Gammaproteobacteria bacterium]